VAQDKTWTPDDSVLSGRYRAWDLTLRRAAHVVETRYVELERAGRIRTAGSAPQLRVRAIVELRGADLPDRGPPNIAVIDTPTTLECVAMTMRATILPK
jgi:hypothetical protein